ncbi:metallophosphoesterase [Arenibacter sp. BSSL-BM3]|uniref:Metallophosphoesterase n=1 Tax=Arenibacter arenosicollis TaxID=2762274 RepID=A0ABR7QTE0_9FLAO|nr:metallophosphoesterase [Arenibacter arenosicollis]MBC8770457.1 metallophosphoesterase [Arenibacter arenosicollis]
MTLLKIKLSIILLALLTACGSKENKNVPQHDLSIGIIADCQYCYCESSPSRFYKNSPDKLKHAVTALNKEDLDYAIHLGDFIDRDFSSFDTVLPIWNGLKTKKYHVLGNHDFSVADSLKSKVMNKMNLTQRYYSLVENNWRFIVLDGNDLSYQGAISPKKIAQTDSLFTLLSKADMPNLQTWNGGLSHEQLQWVESELKLATEHNENVGFYCHFPVLGEDKVHRLWNSTQLVYLIDKYPNVKFYFNGHNHNGDYMERNGVHYLTFKGMVETDSTSAFSTVEFKKDSIFVHGYGREQSRRLGIKN